MSYTTSQFKQMIDMLAAANIKYAQIDHGDGRSTLIIDRTHIDFTRGKLEAIRSV